MRKLALSVVTGAAVLAFAASSAIAGPGGCGSSHDVKSAEISVPAQTATSAPITPAPTGTPSGPDPRG